MDLMLAVTAATKALEGLKLLREMQQSFDQADFKLKIAEISSNVADLKIALTDAKSTLSEKEAEIERLRHDFAIRRDNTVSVEGFTFEKGPGDVPQGMPFCPRCETVDGRLIRLVVTYPKGNYSAVCPQCKADCGKVSGFPYAPGTPSSERVPTIA